MLGGGPASQHPQLRSQQIRGAMPRAVTLRSSCYPQLLCILARFFAKMPFIAPFGLAASRLTRPQRVSLFINLKPRFGLQRPRSESFKRPGCTLSARQRGLSRGETPQGAKALGGRITGETGPCAFRVCDAERTDA